MPPGGICESPEDAVVVGHALSIRDQKVTRQAEAESRLRA
jgi:hypothetical protein